MQVSSAPSPRQGNSATLRLACRVEYYAPHHQFLLCLRSKKADVIFGIGNFVKSSRNYHIIYQTMKPSSKLISEWAENLFSLFEYRSTETWTKVHEIQETNSGQWKIVITFKVSEWLVTITRYSHIYDTVVSEYQCMNCPSKRDHGFPPVVITGPSCSGTRNKCIL